METKKLLFKYITVVFLCLCIIHCGQSRSLTADSSHSATSVDDYKSVTQPGLGGTETGNPSVKLDFGPAPGQNMKIALCVESISIENTDTDAEEEIDLNDSEILLSPSSSTTLGDVYVSPGVYNKIEVRLSEDCRRSKSIFVSNSYGKFSLMTEIKLRFIGHFTVDASTGSIALNMTGLATSLSTVTSKQDLSNVLMGYTGKIRSRRRD